RGVEETGGRGKRDIVAGDGGGVAEHVPMAAGGNGERRARNVQGLVSVKRTKSGKKRGWRGLQGSKRGLQ
ncbi:hypothetical protein CWM40_29125, partial [Escherichia coli]